MKVKIDDLSAEVEKALDSYGSDIQEGLKRVTSKAAKQAVDRLRKTSPQRTGDYRKSWRVKDSTTRIGKPMSTVYNYKYGNLVHLLEFGHAKAGGGRVEGVPHVAPVEKAAEKEFVEDVEKMLREVSS